MRMIKKKEIFFGENIFSENLNYFQRPKMIFEGKRVFGLTDLYIA
jgi:hypothetical protein